MSKVALGDIEAARITINDLDRKLDVVTSKLTYKAVARDFAEFRSTVSKLVLVFNDLSRKEDALKDTTTAAAATSNLTQITTQLESDATSINKTCEAS